ncbi:MAG TPA: metal ABC transporter substrate-binding protein [Acidimicrobiales bacterium]|nr:metal ABC transporter substrate-binding protein [Acidimicrobiales bacterium]
MAVVVATVAAAAGACGRGEGRPDDGRARVVAAFAPLAEVARRVGGDAVDVTDLTPTGVEPHDLELGTDAVDTVEDADLVLYLGGGFQPAIEEVAERTDGTALDLLPDGAGDDPHVWLDPTKLARIVAVVGDALADAAPDGADTFEANAAEYVAELEALDTEMEQGLARCERRVIVTAHAAFGHLAERYDLQQRAIAGTSPESEPDPATLARLADLVATEGVTTIFTEALVAPDVAETLAREAGVRTAVLDPIEGLAEGTSYIGVMRDNLTALRGALGCT